MDKKALISTIHSIANMSLGNEEVSITATNKLLVLITAAGQITGTPLQMSDELQKSDNPNPERYVADTIFSTASKVIAEQGDSSFIFLKDAVLKTPGQNISYQYLCVFTDDVIAATVTNSYPD